MHASHVSPLAYARVAVLIVLFAPALLALDTSGKLLGSIRDPNGLVVPNATVTASQGESGAIFTSTSGNAGAYAFESITPGKYTITCKHPGFRRFVVTEVDVLAQHTTALSILLTVGDVAESIQIEGSSAVDITTSSLQTTLSTSSLLSLPVRGRDLRTAAEELQPGSVTIPNGRGNGVSYNGNRANTNAYRVEGGDVNNYFNGAQNENTTFPQAENLEEFSVLTNAVDAKLGNTSGAYVTAVIRSGSNAPHGCGWAYLENQGWAANNWAANRAGIHRPPGSQQWIGGNLGGPVLLPHLYNGRDRTFFFFSYEYTSPSSHSIQSFILPTAAERAGHFRDGAFPCPIIDGIGTCDVAPARFSPLARSLLSSGLLPLGDASGRFTWTPEKSLRTSSYVTKIDHLLNTQHRLSATFTRNHQDPTSDDFGSCCAIPGTLPGLTEISNPHYIDSIFLNYVFSRGNLVNTLSLGGSHTKVVVAQRKSRPDLSWSSLGVPDLSLERGAQASDVQLFVNSWSGTGFALVGGYYDARLADTINISEEFIWIKGRHTLEAGYTERRNSQSKVGTWGSAGTITYAPGQAGSTGNAWADLFLDLGGEFSQNSREETVRTYPAQSAYFQDRWTLPRRLTATIGLRWDPHEGYREGNNRFSVYRPGQQSIVFPNAPLGLLYYGDPGVSRSGYPDKWWNLGPRVALAYDVLGNGKLALRSGYGLYSDFLTAQNIALDATLPFSRTYSTALNPGQWHIGPNPYGANFMFPFQPPAPGSLAAANFTFPTDPQPAQSFNPDFNSASIHVWNVSLQYEPWSSYIWTLAYVANRATHLLGVDDTNSPVFIPNRSTLANRQARRPDPFYQNIDERYSGLNSRYNALQLSLSKRYRRHLVLLANYTLARAWADGANVPNEAGISGYRDVRRRYLDYGPSPLDVRHRLAVNGSYDLPDFTGRAVILRHLFSHWTLGATLIAQTGFPLTIYSAAPFNAASAGAYANYAGGAVYGDHSTRAAQADAWLNRAVFCRANENLVAGICVADLEVGVSRMALGNSYKGIARGPGRLMQNFTVSRRFPLRDVPGALEFRAAAFNVFNHTALDNPDTSLDSSDFGKISTAAPARSVQLSLRYSF